jgi:SAM-dependent methyltransferase
MAADRRGRVVLVFLWERALDVWALALLALPALGTLPAVVALAVVLAMLVPPLRRVVARSMIALANHASSLLRERHVPIAEQDVSPALVRHAFWPSALTSIGAWLLTSAALVPLAHASGIPVGPIEGCAAAARSVVLGALSLSPVGAGVSGALLFQQLTERPVDPAAATQAVFLFRAATAWLTIGIGGIALWAHRAAASRPIDADHFDDIHECYDTWLPEHIRNHVVKKKIGAMSGHLAFGGAPLDGLDIGCGRGWYLRELLAKGARVVGVDTSIRQLEAARDYVPVKVPLVQGTVLGLPFHEASFDFAYIVNVLHHMPSAEHQACALGEIARTIRPGGTVFVHEFNTINPLFRFYLGYVFPILKGIEEGTEPYMDPRTLIRVPGLELVKTEYFSFTPDFIPASLLAPASAVEGFLEKTPLARYSAHFMAVFRRTSDAVVSPAAPST